MPASFRHLVPPLFVIGLVASFTLALIAPAGWRLLMLVGPCAYGLILCGVGLHVSHRVSWKVGALFPVAAADLMPHLSGPALGQRLEQLERRWIDSGFALSREDLL